MAEHGLKPLRWVASSRDDVRSFPARVRRAVGYALFRAQQNRKAPGTKAMKGIVRGAGVLEITEDHDSNAYRVVYTVRFDRAVYVLHAFQKKSKKGTATPQHEVALIRRRYEAARAHYEATLGRP